MSEAAAPEAPKKKKGKLPIIIALVLVLGGGGFFGMKMSSGGKKVVPKVELGETIALGEFLVNLADGHTFLKADISVQVEKGKHLEEGGGGGHEGKAEPPAPVRDAVIGVLSSMQLRDISSPAGKAALKKLLAKAINEAVPHKEEGKEGGKDEGKEHKKEKKPKKGEAEEEEVVDPSWDSQKGPVLKVYFTNFATQE
ncbi:MAG: flagellar basal body-associated FliL family protein [Armatimonadetes bacterium]|nr:flagellar basal body-associated FliL family protein [Armatimonadota bacterium]